MSRVTNVIFSYGGSVALPLFVWCLISAAVFCSVCAGVVRQRSFSASKPVRSALICLLLLVWTVHSGVLTYTCCQIYRIGWATNWHSGSAPSADMIYNVVLVCLMMAFVAGVLLLCASFVAVWDLQQHQVSRDTVAGGTSPHLTSEQQANATNGKP